ncbi:ABC-type uncharacterized transporter OS=Singulisphaera acidiphila (strain ATCC BAA-1392 / DSM 18658 / VKM B-2454 / MOB10) GN=Sinac_5949 PE=4 SV=1: ABC_transp_aux [Gemmata massiliana]|uniref:DUF7088 domain-containing protein n=1 Tax=Gemmata massiliana TaxID=1210884 RepID=A0A6P2DC62_9BACT|nr:Gldg family protein [Gemmata massiliana]VTR99422.1 ABC-type uncharacterized transporter OS=Singulisphaera acidiphila (strain ATCC BAA-1392 / DSM 18658 / VKM B-2454 / MOB10) GN=Sinac_5949 PE=4 SV=1: ABC_transp_aux [Gemmata massiliana]
MQPTPTEPVPSAPGAAPSFAAPLVEFVRRDRQTTGFILLALSVALLALCAWTVVKTVRASGETEPEKQQKKADDPFAFEDAPLKAHNPNRVEYIAGAVLAGAAFLTAAAAAVWLLVSIPPLSEARQRTDARTLILAVSGVLGGLLILGGIWYAYLWIGGSLTEWTDKGQKKQAKWVLYPLMMIACGAALMFIGAQPARAEERSNRALRQWVYGSNLGLSVLLLIVALLVVNLIVGPRLPNKLDTTSEGFYSLAPGTKEFLTRLDQPVTAYAVLSESGSRTAEDIRRLVQNCQDASGGKFQVRIISPTANKGEYRTLAGKYPVLEVNDFGVLLTVGEDEKRHSFIREDEFTQRDTAQAPGADAGRSFIGEARLMRELLFLSENEKKAVVYFTQSAGELDVSGAPNEDLRPSASASRLRAFLERNYLEVKPLKFDPASPKVPDDATVVVVAEPQSPLSEAHVGALRQYMTEPRGGKKGKLVVLAGPRFGPNDKVLRTGLEPLLAEFNVRLGERVVVGEETRELDPFTQYVGFTEAARRAKHPVAITLGEKVVFVAPLWRPVVALRQGAPAYQAVPLLATTSGRFNWLEDERPRDLSRIFDEFRTHPEIRAVKELTENSRPVGAVVSEGESGRLAVFGNGLIVSDAVGRQSQQSGDPITFDLVGGTIDWLRDRPSFGIGVESKKYKTVLFPATADETRGLWVPLFFSLIAIGGLGASVWVVRRR